jgi:hypothetical protein
MKAHVLVLHEANGLSIDDHRLARVARAAWLRARRRQRRLFDLSSERRLPQEEGVGVMSWAAARLVPRF